MCVKVIASQRRDAFWDTVYIQITVENNLFYGAIYMSKHAFWKQLTDVTHKPMPVS